MGGEGVLIVFFIIVIIIIVVLITNVDSDVKSENIADAIAKVKSRGLQESIIKQDQCDFRVDNNYNVPGLLTLTWELICFIGSGNEIEIPVEQIRSTSSEKSGDGTYVVILCNEHSFKFFWNDDKRTSQGIGVIGGHIGSAMGLSKSMNPNVYEWIRLIDDLRFGRLKKQ